MTGDAATARWAIEALRNGVPNRHAVALLGSSQPDIEARFRQLALETAIEPGTRGFLVCGEFGAGKSHLLYALRQVASDLGFATATIAVSKETPLNSFPRVARKILAQLRLPDMEGRGYSAISTRARFQSEEWHDLQSWADSLEFGNGWWSATLELFTRLGPQHEFSDRIVRFWGGENDLTSRALRDELSRLHLTEIHPVGPRPAAADLDFQRLAFASRFVQGLGLKGLVVFIDEIELLAQFQRLQRLQAYRNLALLLGRVERDDLADAALLVAGAVTSDFEEAILRGKDDFEEVPRLADLRYGPEAAEACSAGMEAIRAALPLKPPDQAEALRTYKALTGAYQSAYPGWSPPRQQDIKLYASTRMRELVRRWITEWDLMRYYEGPVEVEAEEFGGTPTTEDSDLTDDQGDGTS